MDKQDAANTCISSLKCHNCHGTCWFDSVMSVLFGKIPTKPSLYELLAASPKKTLFSENLDLLRAYGQDTVIDNYHARKMTFYKQLVAYYRDYVDKLLDNLVVQRYEPESKIYENTYKNHIEPNIELFSIMPNVAILNHVANGNNTSFFMMIFLESLYQSYCPSPFIKTNIVKLKGVKYLINDIVDYVKEVFDNVSVEMFPKIVLLDYDYKPSKYAPNFCKNLYSFVIRDVPYGLLCCIVHLDTPDGKHSVVALLCGNGIMVYNSSECSHKTFEIVNKNTIPFYNGVEIGIPLKTNKLDDTTTIQQVTFVYEMFPNSQTDTVYSKR